MNRSREKGPDLLYTMDITLAEALCGFTRTITHLDGRVLKVQSPSGQVVPQDALKLINGEGMPYQGNIFTKGKLVIHFKISFPTTLPQDAVMAIRNALPRPSEPMLTGEEEECNMVDTSLAQFGQGESGRKDATDEDEEDRQGGAQRVQCANS